MDKTQTCGSVAILSTITILQKWLQILMSVKLLGKELHVAWTIWSPIKRKTHNVELGRVSRRKRKRRRRRRKKKRSRVLLRRELRRRTKRAIT